MEGLIPDQMCDFFSGSKPVRVTYVLTADHLAREAATKLKRRVEATRADREAFECVRLTNEIGGTERVKSLVSRRFSSRVQLRQTE